MSVVLWASVVATVPLMILLLVGLYLNRHSKSEFRDDRH